jgi:hypothetical protein
MNKNEALVKHYEEIRRTFLDRHQGLAMWGFAVLRTKGMTAWVMAWREYSQGNLKHMQPRHPAAAVSRLPPASEEVVMLLAAMVWAVQKEEVS